MSVKEDNVEEIGIEVPVKQSCITHRRSHQRTSKLDESVLMAVLGAALLAFFTLLGDRCTTKSASASPGDCESIHDADKRNFCRAVTRKMPSWCEFIKDGDLRAQCRAQVRK